MAGSVIPLKDQFPEQKPDQVTSYETSNLWSPLGGQRYNPDDLVAQKGLPIYSKMLNDEQVKSVTEFKLNAILGRGWQFKFHRTRLSEEEKKERIAVFEHIVKMMRGSFIDAIEGVATGREFGFSMTEKVYGDVDFEGKTFRGINMLLTRDPCSFDFFADEYGILRKAQQRTAGRKIIDLDIKRFIHYVHKPKWDLIYGRSELRAAYRAWYAKDALVKLWLLHLEKFGSGVWKAMLAEDSGIRSGSVEYESLQRALNNAKSLANIILPPGVTAEIEFPATTDQYEKALQYFDLAIAKSQLVPNLLGLSHTGQTGAYSQSQTQFEAFYWTTSTDGARLAECLNEQLFRDLGDQNWGDGDYPSFCFKPVSMEHAKWMLETWKGLLGAKAVQATEEDERVLRQLLEMPERDEESELLVDPMAERQMALQEEQAKAMQEGRVTAEDDDDPRLQRMSAQIEELRATVLKLSQPLNVTVHNPAPVPPFSHRDTPSHDGPAAGAVIVPHGPLRSCSNEQFSRAVQRVAFSVIEKRTDDYAASAVGNLATIVAKATKRALGDEAAMTQLLDEDVTDIAALDVAGADRSKLKSACRDLLMQSWALGSDLAANELDRARGTTTDLAARRLRFASLRDKAAGYFETQSFRMAGDASDQVRKIIQQELQNGVKFAKSVPEVRSAIWQRLLERGLTTPEAVKGIETEQVVIDQMEEFLQDQAASASYLNTLVRTNTFEALNEARFAEFTDPEVSEFVQALEYAAVLDSSTTDICRALDNRVYNATSPLWDQYRPPNHYNALPMGTRVYTKHGYRPIEELRKGTLVLTHAGRYRRITETMMHENWPTEVVLHLEGGKQFVCTEDHPVLTVRGWVCAGDLTEYDEVIAMEGPCQECGIWTDHAKFCSKRCADLVAGRRFKAHAKARHCQRCGEEIKIKGKKKNALYCGQSCMADAMRRLPVRSCECCGNPMRNTWKKPVSQERRFCSQSCYFKHKGETSIERTVREWLAEAHIQAEPQKRFGRYTVDFYLPLYRAVIEVDGDYWHTVLEKPKHKLERREQYLSSHGLTQIRVPQSAVESGRFKKIISEWLHACKAHAARQDHQDRAATVHQPGV